MQELELKMQGGLMREGGGVIAGFYGIRSRGEAIDFIYPILAGGVVPGAIH